MWFFVIFGVCLMSQSVVSSKNETENCPEGWDGDPSKAPGCYRVFSSGFARAGIYPNLENFCKKSHGTLATFHSAKELKYLHEVARSQFYALRSRFHRFLSGSSVQGARVYSENLAATKGPLSWYFSQLSHEALWAMRPQKSHAAGVIRN